MRFYEAGLTNEHFIVMRDWSRDQRQQFDERVALLHQMQNCPERKAEQIAFWEIHDPAALHAYYRMRENPVELKAAYDELMAETTAAENKLALISTLLYDLQHDALRYVNYVEKLRGRRPVLADAGYDRLFKKLRRRLPDYIC